MNWQDYVHSLWTERMIWIRQLVISIMLGLRDVAFVAQRAMRNSADFGRVIASVYGPAAGKRFEDFLTQYVLILSEVASTVKAGQNTDLVMQQWYKTVDDIADFLSQLNPYWRRDVTEPLLRAQVLLEFEYIQKLGKEQFAEGIESFDPAHGNAIKAAQLMIDGIKLQFGI